MLGGLVGLVRIFGVKKSVTKVTWVAALCREVSGFKMHFHGIFVHPSLSTNCTFVQFIITYQIRLS